MKFLSAFFIACSLAAATPAFAQTSIQTPDDILNLVERNFDLNLQKANTLRSQSSLNKLKGTIYYPRINAKGSHVDNRREPLTPFLPARSQETFWQAYLESKTPFGMNVSGGQGMLRSRFYQSDPPNPLLPYPATYYQPEAFVRASLNLSQDLLGAITRKELEIARTDLRTAQTQEALLKHKTAMVALQMFYQIPALIRIRENAKGVIGDFRVLEKSLTQKVDRYLSEKSDLMNIQKEIALQQGVVSDTDAALVEMKRSLALFLGDANLKINPKVSSGQVSGWLNSCESKILDTSFHKALTREFEMLADERKKSELSARIYKRRILPEVNAVGTIYSTGTDSTLSGGYEEMNDFDRPAYEAALTFSWQPSPPGIRAARQLGASETKAAKVQEEKRLEEQRELWGRTQENIGILRAKYSSLKTAVRSGGGEVDELKEQYGKGRMSLVELGRQRVNLLQAGIEVENAEMQRIANVLGAMQFFNRFECQVSGGGNL